MPLTRSSPIGFDVTRMVFEFSMMNGEKPVRCEISSAAMDTFREGNQRIVGADERPQVLTDHREAIEQIASGLWDSQGQPEVVRAFYKHCK